MHLALSISAAFAAASLWPHPLTTMFYYVHTMQLSCKCGASWEYKGRAEVYACCPRCKSKVKIDTDDGPLCLERWAVRVPIEITLPNDLQKAAEEFFQGRRPGPYSHIALASVIRHNFSNYDELIFQLENKSLVCRSHPKEVMAAQQTLRERFDRQICKHLGLCRCGHVMKEALSNSAPLGDEQKIEKDGRSTAK